MSEFPGFVALVLGRRALPGLPESVSNVDQVDCLNSPLPDFAGLRGGASIVLERSRHPMEQAVDEAPVRQIIVYVADPQVVAQGVSRSSGHEQGDGETVEGEVTHLHRADCGAETQRGPKHSHTAFGVAAVAYRTGQVGLGERVLTQRFRRTPTGEDERMRRTWLWVALPAAAGAGIAGYLGLITAAVPVDLGLGRRRIGLGPQLVRIGAPRELVFDVLAEPYLGRQTRATAEKVRVLERGSDMVLAAHRTPIRGALVATTVETVRFYRPDRIEFGLVRGPVPEVSEQFTLSEDADGTRLEYRGQLGTDLWSVGAAWGRIVGKRWESAVAATFDAVKAEAERRNATTAR